MTNSIQPDIAVIGSINMDLVFRTPRLPVTGETLCGHAFHQIGGGKGANQAVAAARQGAMVQFIACVGNDANGALSLSQLQAEGINTTHITCTSQEATGVAGIFVDDNGNNSIVIAPGANALLSVAHIEAAQHIIQNSQLLICQLETPLPTITYAIELAARQAIPVIFNPAPAYALPDTLLASVSYLILNETEAQHITGIPVTGLSSAFLASEQLLSRGAHAVLLTMGEQGVCISELNNSRHFPAIKTNVIDTTAAGDTFVGAFAAGIAQGLSIDQSATEAQYAAALTVSRLGAQTSIPHRYEVIALMASK